MTDWRARPGHARDEAEVRAFHEANRARARPSTPTGDGTADLVYSGRGAIGWVHDLGTWMAVVARLLRPGGVLHLLSASPSTLPRIPRERRRGIPMTYSLVARRPATT